MESSTSNDKGNDNSSTSQYDEPKEDPSQYGSDKCAASKKRYRRQSDCKNSKTPNCWSAGTYDLDCPNSGLCCFDGCVNRCVDEAGDDLPTYNHFSGDSSPSYRPQSTYKSPEEIPNNYALPVRPDREENRPSYESGSTGSSSTGYGGSSSSGASSHGASGTSPGTGYGSPSYEDSYDPLDPLEDPFDHQQYDNEEIEHDGYSGTQDYSGPSASDSPNGYNTLGQLTGNFQFDFPIFGTGDIPSAIGDVVANTYKSPSSSSTGAGYKLTTTQAPKANIEYKPPEKNDNPYIAPTKKPSGVSYRPPIKDSNPYGNPINQQHDAGSKNANDKTSSGPVVVLHIYSNDAGAIAAYNHVGDFRNTIKERADEDKVLEIEAERIDLRGNGDSRSKSYSMPSTKDDRRKRKVYGFGGSYIDSKKVTKTYNKKPSLYSPATQSRNQVPFHSAVNPQTIKRCPFVGRKSSIECRNSVSAECDNPNVNDAKCHKGGLCCFDGCTFRCIEHIETQVKRRSYEEIKHGSAVQVYDPNKNLGVCKKVYPLPSHMCRLRFVHECHAVGRSNNECSRYNKNTFCCFDGCINSCVDVHKTTFSFTPSHSISRSSHEEKTEDNFDMFSHPTSRHPRLHSLDGDIMGNVHDALYGFFMGENYDRRK